ncbi:MAG: NAD(+)/NADH kinase [Pirellulales bacterium]|nr:NAD(+)/NADH kinase [Pirellulales bacterium]
MSRPQPQEKTMSDRLLRAVVLGYGQRPGVREEAQRLESVVGKQVEIVATDLSGEEDVSSIDADVAIVLGGDGSILRAAHQMGDHQLPVVAVNLGKLGFLADLTTEELPDVLADFRCGSLPVIEHLMFQCELWRDGQRMHRDLGLNEVVVHAGAPFTMLDVDLFVDGEPVTTYSCDGLILSTPVGSTAHSLSAGGPILRKDLQAFVISPISPHTLTHRPVVDGAHRVYELVVAQPNPRSSVVVDGRALDTLAPNDRVRVTRADVQFRLVAAPGHTYYRTLREKLGWSGRLKYGNDS